MNISTVCFTGHRPSDLGTTPAVAKSALRKAITEAIKRGATTFIAGGAIGVDTYASQLVIEAKASNPSIKLYIAVPFRGFTKYWSNAQRIEYADIIRKCDGFKVICDKPSKHAYHVRNSFMVDRADLVIAYWSGKRSGGTYATVQYAQQTHTPVVNCYPKAETPNERVAKKDKELHYDAYKYEERFTINSMKQICCSQCQYNGQCNDKKVVKCAAWKCLPHTPGALDKSIVDLYWSVAVHMEAELGYLDPTAPPIIPQSLKASR